MSCNCISKVARNADGEAFPLITTEYGLTNPQESTCCGPADSCPSEGSALPSYLMDSCCENEGVVILTRKGAKLARFTKSGFIKLNKGKAEVVDIVPLRTNELYHRRYQSAGKGLPALGEPFDSKYDVVADESGKMYAQRGTTEDSVKMWNADLKTHQVTPVSELPKTHKGLLPRESELELVGFTPIPDSGSSTDVRELSVLSGSGVIFFEQQETIPSSCNCEGCQPQEATASVAKFLPFPTEEGNWVLSYNIDDGPFWSRP